MTVYKSISESLVWDSDLSDLMEIGGLDPDIILETEEDVRTDITAIRAALETDGDTYNMTDEEMISEILEIMKRLETEQENEEQGTSLYQRVAAECLECDPKDLEELNYDHYGLVIFSDGTNEVAVGNDTEAYEAAKECIEQEAWSFKSDFIASHSKNGYSPELAKAIRIAQAEMDEDAQDLVIAVIDDIDEFVNAAISEDGRGTFLNLNDNTEEEITYKGETYYCYKIR